MFIKLQLNIATNNIQVAFQLVTLFSFSIYRKKKKTKKK